MHILNLHMINGGRMKAFRLGWGDRGDRVMKGRCAGVLKRVFFWINTIGKVIFLLLLNEKKANRSERKHKLHFYFPLFSFNLLNLLKNGLLPPIAPTTDKRRMRETNLMVPLNTTYTVYRLICNSVVRLENMEPVLMPGCLEKVALPDAGGTFWR